MAERVCPWYVGYILANPLRNLFQKPEKILGDYISPGMTVLDIGSAMGFFSLAMARMVGPEGRVVCVDMQEKMINGLMRRAKRASLTNIIDARICTEQSLKIDDLAGQVDFALAFYVIHEVPDVKNLLNEIYIALKPGGKLYVAEPKGHTTEENCKEIEKSAENMGLSLLAHPKMRGSWTAVFKKN